MILFSKHDSGRSLTPRLAQTLDELNVYIAAPPGARASDLRCDISPRRVVLGARGLPPYLDVRPRTRHLPSRSPAAQPAARPTAIENPQPATQEALHLPVKASESFWTLGAGPRVCSKPAMRPRLFRLLGMISVPCLRPVQRVASCTSRCRKWSECAQNSTAVPSPRSSAAGCAALTWRAAGQGKAWSAVFSGHESADPLAGADDSKRLLLERFQAEARPRGTPPQGYSVGAV